jgi:hypothetical protein
VFFLFKLNDNCKTYSRGLLRMKSKFSSGKVFSAQAEVWIIMFMIAAKYGDGVEKSRTLVMPNLDLFVRSLLSHII